MNRTFASQVKGIESMINDGFTIVKKEIKQNKPVQPVDTEIKEESELQEETHIEVGSLDAKLDYG
jgi:hypothetical protein